MLLPSFLCALLVLSGDAAESGRPRPRQAPQQTSPTQSPPYPEPTRRNAPGDVEYRLTRLEVILVEKLDNIRNDVRDVTRRIQALEWQSTESQATFENFRSDLARISQQVSSPPSIQQPQGGSQLEARVDNLVKGVQILVAATRGLTSDVFGLKKNVSFLVNDTRSFLSFIPQLVTKQFLNNGLLELKHHQVQPWSDTMQCPMNGLSSSGIPKNCREVYESGQHKSGIYRIQPEGSAKPFMVVCDHETRGGGWTVIHNRFDGTQDFYQNWHDYKHGFGNLGGEFWLGLDYVHHLTGSTVNELLVELQDLDLESKSAYYSAFSIGSEIEGFPLKVLGGYSGDAGDSLLYHAGSRFSAKDMDQDGWPEGSCAQAHGGAWWYRSCDMSNLNGRYLSGQLPEQYVYQGMYWGEFRGAQYSLNRARMLVRPRKEISHPLVDEIFDKNMSAPKIERDQAGRS